MDTPAHPQLHVPQTNRDARIEWYQIANKAWDSVNILVTLWVTIVWGFKQDQERLFKMGEKLIKKKPESCSQVFSLINNPADKLHRNCSKRSPTLLLPKAPKTFKSTLWNVLCDQKPWIMGSLGPSVCLPRLPSSPHPGFSRQESQQEPSPWTWVVTAKWSYQLQRNVVLR